jgi:hypothetical protein
MAHHVGARSYTTIAPTLFLVLSWLLGSSSSAQVRNAGSISGTVLDQVSGAIGGARVTASDASGATVQTTTSDAVGAFSLSGLAPGMYTVLVEMNLFAPIAESVTVAD